jgi:Heparinase II/III-like protein
MVALSSQIFHFTNEGLRYLQSPHRQVFPELEMARSRREYLLYAPQTQIVLQQTQYLLQDIERVPQTDYTSYRMFRRVGERDSYQNPYFLKRARLSAAALRLFLVSYPEIDREKREIWIQPSAPLNLKDVVQNYIWHICEESTWVLPAHEWVPIDLFAAETSFLLAEVLLLLGDSLDEEVRHRVREEIERRIFDPYLRFYHLHNWYQGENNWNGVCNSSIAISFLLLEAEPTRLKRALEIALTGLDTFLDTAFEEDGSSNEGVSYWHYGLINFVALSEYLYALSDGNIDLCAPEKMRRVANFPAKLRLSGSHFASFADCDELVRFHPGIITRLEQRTGEASLRTLLASPAEPDSDWRLAMMLRDILWWDGTQSPAILPTDTCLPVGGTARLVLPMDVDHAFVLAVKAGHNDEQHNHNDIGSFLLHVAGENVLTDPGRGLYSRDYFSSRRYENIFANSYSHSVPRIDGMLQGSGRAFAGRLLERVEESGEHGYKQVSLEFADAYPCPDLTCARRELRLVTEGNGEQTAWLHDSFVFAEGLHEVEEAFVTWLACEVNGATAHIYGQQVEATLKIEQQSGLHFQLEYLEEQSKANQKPEVLKRLSIIYPRAKAVEAEVRITVRRIVSGQQ